MRRTIITIALIIVAMIVSSILTIGYTMNTARVDIIEESEQGVIVRVDTMSQWFTYYTEK